MTTAIAENHRRQEKLELLRSQGVDPYPSFSSKERNLAAKITAQHEQSTLNTGAHPSHRHSVAGRLVGRKRRGNAIAFELRDRSGTIPLFIDLSAQDQETGSAESLGLSEWDIGDIVAASGHLYVSRTGQIGIEIISGTLLGKALRLNHALRDSDVAPSRHELGLMASNGYRNIFVTRSTMLKAFRDWLSERDFIEIETPTLQALAGGALARPFLTHHNALDSEVSLRVSAELYLKRCTVGDMERVYDLGRRFRNEGVSAVHSPEFTMLEWSMAYSTYRDAATMTEQIVVDAAKQVLGCLRVMHNGNTIDLDGPWRRTSLRDVISDTLGLDIFSDTREELLAALPNSAVSDMSWSRIINKLYSTYVEPNLIQPTIVFDFPLEIHPCLKQSPANSRLGESFDVAIGGMEIGTGGTEVTDPHEQWRRFVEQSQSQGPDAEHEPHPNDQEYVTALEFCAPPSSGVGIGIERLLMVLLNRESIHEVSSFPVSR